jgi:hypothetical protein
MTPHECPQHVLVKLFALQSHVEQCGREADAAERARDSQRAVLNDRHPHSMREHKAGTFSLAAEQKKLEQLQFAATALRQAATAEAAIWQRCRAWIEALPNGTALETVSPAVGGQYNLQEVRTRLAAIAAELAALQRVPTPDPNLRRRIERYVEDLAENAMPELQGIAANQELRVYWPGEARASRRNLNNFDTISANSLLMTAWLQPNLLVDRLVAIANRMADELVPAAERPARIAALEAEALTWRYVEESLVTRALSQGDTAVRDPNALPECVLQVRVRSNAKVTKSAPREAAEPPQSEMTVGASP